MEAIILAGGFGTRLQHIMSDLPKPMAPMNEQGTPFLSLLLDRLYMAHFSRVVLSTGYMKEKIGAYFGARYRGMEILYAEEDTPLLTGGAIKKALESCEEDAVFTLNGDTYFEVDFADMQKVLRSRNADIVMAVKEMKNFDRYGTVMIENDRVLDFEEKKYCRSGWINGGIYCIRRDLLNGAKRKFSFEKYLEKEVGHLNIVTYSSEGFFIDIGIPQDYLYAQQCYKEGLLR